MSFVTKRERVFNDEVDLYDLPPRNECKLKAYASCTDARAWSHFYSDQSEHLVDIIKRNNTSCAPKYVPTKVIVDTIMSQKNCEISRLRRKIDTLDQMLAVYDQLELDCGQKCEIARAHESIKAASKDLDEVCLDLDMSGFTEGFVESSDVYETGKSRGDDMEKSKGDMSVYSRVTSTELNTEAKGVQKTPAVNDAGTVAKDPRIEMMQDEIIFKDAKLNAMQNSMAVLENDVCEPYCIYAHIYTALEKIYGILYQNDTYKQYLELLSVGKDIRCLDIKGRILFKMKVLEKFSLALVAPCSKKFAAEAEKENAECDCGNTKIVARVETAYALTASESEPPPTSDSKRAHLVAEIMDNDEMKEILERDFISDGLDTGNAYCGVTCYSIDAENVKRLKDLQKSFDELVECFDNLKHEKDCLQVRCRKYNELEMEVETLRDQLAACKDLWNDKERFRKRSVELEDIREKYLILQNVNGNLESELKAEKEINNNKMQLIEDLRNENLILERKLSDATIAFEREKSAILCKLKEFECALSCKDQEVQSLSDQLQKHFDGSQDRERDSIKTFSLLNEIESLKAELMNAKGLLNCCDEEKQHIKEEFQDKLSLINDLRMEIEDWKGDYENLLAQNKFMESQFESDIADLEEKNEKLTEEMDSKTKAMSNLMEMLSEKSKEINTLLEDIENKKQENEQIMSEVLSLRNEHSICKEQFETEKFEIQELLESERRKSKQLEDALHSDNQQDFLQNKNIHRTSDTHPRDYDSLRTLLEELSKENQLIREKLNKGECCQVDFKQENEKLNDIIKNLHEDKRECETSHNLLKEELKNLKQKFEDLKKDNINKSQNLDSMVAELNNWKHKCHQLGGEIYDYVSDNYEEAESSPGKRYNSLNSNGTNMQSFDKPASQIQRAGSLGKNRFSGSQEYTGFNLDSNHRERVSLLIADNEALQRVSLIGTDETTKRLSDANQSPSYNLNNEALQRDSERQTRARLSADGRVSLIGADEIATRFSDSNQTPLYNLNNEALNHRERVSLLGADNEALQGDSERQTRGRLLSADGRVSLFGTDETTKRLSDANQSPSYNLNNEAKTRACLSADERISLIGADEIATRFSDSNQIPSYNLNNEALQRYSERQIRAGLFSADEKATSLELDVKIKEFFLDPNALSSDLANKRKDLAPLEQAQIPSSTAYEKGSYQDSQEQNRFKMVDENDRNSSELKELSELLKASIITQDVFDSQERTRRVSYDENASRRVSELQDYDDENALRRDSKYQDPTFQPFEDEDLEHKLHTRRDSDRQEQIRLLEPEPRLTSLDEQAFGRDLESQEREKVLSVHEQAMRRDSILQNQKLSQDKSEKSHRRDLEPQSDDLVRVSNHRERVSLLGADNEALQCDSERQTRGRLISADGRVSLIGADEITTRFSESNPTPYNLNNEALQCESERQTRARLSADEKDSLIGTDEITKRFSESNQTPSYKLNNEALQRDSERETGARLLSADGKTTPLDFGVQIQGKFLDSALSVSPRVLEIQEKSQIDTTLTSHDLRPLERARTSAADEMIKDSPYQEKDKMLSSENEKRFTNHHSDMDKDWQHEEDFDNYNQHNRQLNDDDIISSNKYNIRPEQRSASIEKHDGKLGSYEKSSKGADPWKLERDSEYSSRRPSFGKAEAEESLKKQRRYSDAQYESFDETNLQKSESESRSRRKRQSEEKTDRKQKYDEPEGEKHEKLSSALQDKDMELQYWKNKYIEVEKDTCDKQNILDEFIQEKNLLEQTLRDKDNELAVEKDRNKLYVEKAHEIESIEKELQQKNLLYESALEEKTLLHQKLDDTNRKMAELLQLLEQEKSQLFILSNRIPDLEGKLQEYQNEIDNALTERESLKNQLKINTDELNAKMEENNALNEKLLELRLSQTTSDNYLATLQNQKDELDNIIKAMEKEFSKLLTKLEDSKSLLEDLDRIKNDYDNKEKENKSLKDKLNQMEMQFKLLEKENNDYISALAADNNELENLLTEAREEITRGLESPERSFYQTVKDEVNTLKRESYDNHAEIRALKDQQDANENLISELRSELMTRDERISILENHINLLQDEIKKLHKNLDDGVSASEQLQEQTFEGYDNSMKLIEAHHSKAFHNMKTEIAKLEKEKADWQELLSNTRNENEELTRDKNAYLSKIAELTNEKEEMLKELKKLELTATGKTDLMSDNDSDIQRVRESFSRISNNLEANRSQSSALESKLNIVKKSSKELFSKTNEAKMIAEKEKQKILLEKEEAIRERTNLENQMQELKSMFSKQHDDDAATIEDLKKEILNQTLLMNKLKNSSQEYEQKLKDDFATMENLYKDSQMEIEELKLKLQDANRKNDEFKDTIKMQTDTFETQTQKLNDTIEKYNKILQNNDKEISELQDALNVVISISKIDAQTQKDLKTQKNIETQKDIKTQKDKGTQFQKEINAIPELQKQQNDFAQKKSRVQERIHRKASENLTEFAENMTELQIMSANVQPTLDFVKNTYTKYKQGQLSPTPVEHQSISSLVEPILKEDSNNQLIDIYSRQSSAIEDLQYDKTNNNDQSLNNNTDKNINKNKQAISSSGQSNDEDVFVIYTSSETVHKEQPPNSIPDSGTSNRISKNEELTLTNKTDLEKGFDDSSNKTFANEVNKPRERNVALQEPKSDKDAKVKISVSDDGFALPKKDKPNVTVIDNIENDEKSAQSSYNIGDVSQQILLHGSDTDDDKLKRKETQSKSNLSLNDTKLDSDDFFDNLSNDQDNHFKLGRIYGESIIFKDNDSNVAPETSEKLDMGLNFILETAKHETQETLDYNTNLLRRSQSAESFSKNSSQTGQEKSLSTIHRQQIVSHSAVMPLKEKKVADKEVFINIDPSDKASKKIEQLTAALNNSERDYKKKLDAIKAQYDANIKRMINEHNEGVINLQNLHENMVKDLVKKHESEVENLRSISFESIKRAEQMEKENKLLKSRLGYSGNDILDQVPVKIDSKSKVRDARLSKTTIESFDVKPRMRHAGPCTCSLDPNVSDTIRNIFDQVDQDQRKLAEVTYVKYIAHKMLSGNVDALDSQELAFLHYNVCRHWKVKQNIEDTLRQKIDSLETELISKQRHAQQHIAELDRRVAEERRRLQEVREAVGYQPAPVDSHDMQPDRDNNDASYICGPAAPHPPMNMHASCSPIRVKKIRLESHGSERRCQKPQQPQTNPDEMPTRLRRFQDRTPRCYRK